MKIVQLTPGAGGMYCGGCLRDNALVRAWRESGHEALLVPLYLPLRLDEPDSSDGSPIFFGGINVYLQQKSALFRKTPQWVDKALDAPSLLKVAAHFTGRTRPEELGEITISMLKGEEGRQAKELEKLLSWLMSTAMPDVVSISNLLLVGLARRIKKALRVPVVCSFQGEHIFLDELPDPYRTEAWALLSERAADADAHIAPSRFYADYMGERLKLPKEKIQVVYNGIALDGYEAAGNPGPEPTLGYFARLGPEKGLATLVDAFCLLKKRSGLEKLKLRAGGSLGPADQAFVDGLATKVADAGWGDDLEFVPNVDRAGKQEFLRSLNVFSVPATYGEAFGLYVLEALASGVPCVLPRHGAFPELARETGGVVLCEPDNARALADALEPLLLESRKAKALGEAGRRAIQERFSAAHMARQVDSVLERLVKTTQKC